MTIPTKIRQILRFLLVALCIYAFIILLFGYLYWATGGIGYYKAVFQQFEKPTFEKAIYFSVVSFHTIGYGDMYPVTQQGRIIMMFESFASMFYFSIFSGLLVYFIIRRPTDIFTTKKVYIRLRNEKWSLSIRLGNKGRAIIDLKGKFEAWIVRDNTRIRIFQYEEEMADLERILYFDINLKDHSVSLLRENLRDALEGKILLHMKFAFIGNDIRSGDQVALARYYDSNDLRFGKMFLNVYSWDTTGRRYNYEWKNFERIEPIPEKQVRDFLSGSA
jgi:TRAP-type C4-dicarboxylate transport system permease small subunit